MATTAHGILTADAVTSVTIDAGRGGVVIVNRQQSGVIWVRYDGEDPEPEQPDTYAVYGAREFPIYSRSRQGVTVEFRLLSEESKQYSVEAY
jgi:hypothetical protein